MLQTDGTNGLPGYIGTDTLPKEGAHVVQVCNFAIRNAFLKKMSEDEGVAASVVSM